eukprot:CAMPEP_0169451420 /NCGR_PEP_ID=MMETSP1042-20121227/13690_1 /TAXON_ID=464988 /ORGANISM="Hemiselmis andersenii, Strain CCMP1180" /LENGTH=190 /DNA_ID=CAMNT_0009563335 /DNA_START=544 /DNA_END=1113 /DNA_ORIENTATION=-
MGAVPLRVEERQHIHELRHDRPHDPLGDGPPGTHVVPERQAVHELRRHHHPVVWRVVRAPVQRADARVCANGSIPGFLDALYDGLDVLCVRDRDHQHLKYTLKSRPPVPSPIHLPARMRRRRQMLTMLESSPIHRLLEALRHYTTTTLHLHRHLAAGQRLRALLAVPPLNDTPAFGTGFSLSPTPNTYRL